MRKIVVLWYANDKNVIAENEKNLQYNTLSEEVKNNHNS